MKFDVAYTRAHRMDRKEERVTVIKYFILTQLLIKTDTQITMRCEYYITTSDSNSHVRLKSSALSSSSQTHQQFANSNTNAGYLRWGFEFFLNKFAEHLIPTLNCVVSTRTRRALRNEGVLNIIHVNHPSEYQVYTLTLGNKKSRQK